MYLRTMQKRTPVSASRLAVIRYAAGIFLTAVSIPLLSQGQEGGAALTLVCAALLFSIASLDMAAARIARVRT
ncbi:MAG TPA: hypothetical protein VGM14_09770 [Streptosporangiaceae bacterium]|jgi:hypothetical protein